MKIDKFTGIDNINFPQKLPLGTCLEATNIVFTGDGRLMRCPGMLPNHTASIIGSYGTFDQSQMFYVTAGLQIFKFDGISHVQVGTVPHDDKCYWAEESSDVVFLAQSDNIQVWNGVAFSPLTADAMGLSAGLKPLYATGEIVRVNWVAGRLCVVTQSENTSKVYFSVPGMYGMTTIEEDWFEIPHVVTGVESFATNMIISCTNAVFHYNTQTGILTKRLEYGTPFGRPIARVAADKALIWSNRGVIRYPEWDNITLSHFTVPPGEGCATAIMQYAGAEFFLVSHDDAGYNYNT